MSAVDFGPVETWPVAQQSAVAAATRACVVANLKGGYGYAVLSGGEIDVHVFADRKTLLQAMASAFTRNGRFQYPLSWEDVLFFEPEEPLRFFLEIEEDDEVAQ